jgi:hypothetical protein
VLAIEQGKTGRGARGGSRLVFLVLPMRWRASDGDSWVVAAFDSAFVTSWGAGSSGALNFTPMSGYLRVAFPAIYCMWLILNATDSWNVPIWLDWAFGGQDALAEGLRS